MLFRSLGASVLVLDDGFQHHRLAKDLEIVLVDATCPWGHGHLLPRGLLREPRATLRLADAVILTRCDQVNPRALASLKAQVERLAPGKPILASTHQPASLTRLGADPLPAEWLKGRNVAAFCGLGRPAAFKGTLEASGARVVAWREFPDHHAYGRDDIRSLREWAESLPEGTPVICTHKDLVKLRVERLGDVPRVCIYGDKDPEDACPAFAPGLIRPLRVAGGHHFDGDYAPVSDAILRAAGA